MFSLATHRLIGRRILVIEAETDFASEMREAILSHSGIALGPTSDIGDALSYITNIGHVDCVMLDTRFAQTKSALVPDVFRNRGVEAIFVTGHDEWFDVDEDDVVDAVPLGGRALAAACS
jgi:hypothetical protein